MILTLLFAGCGYKGPLYLPKDKPAAVKKPAPAPAAVTPAAEPPAPSGPQ
ncbi:MAG: lipoprotein [Burkholderiales bacterium]|nr:lipoprotein [Burkholderiales bacterium]